MRFPARLVRDWTSKRGATRDPESSYNVRSVYNPNDNRPEDDEPDTLPLLTTAAPLIWEKAEKETLAESAAAQPAPSQTSWWEQQPDTQPLTDAAVGPEPIAQLEEQRAAADLLAAQPQAPDREEIVEDYDPKKEEEDLTLG